MDLGEREHRLVERTVAALHEILDADLLGVYLHGSAVLGGLRPTSDVDLLAVTRRPLADDERRRLLAALLDLSGSRARTGPARPLELTVVVEDDVRPWRYPPRLEFLYGEWLRAAFERGDVPEPEAEPDLAVAVTTVLRAGVPVLGPPPRSLLDPVPPADLRRAVLAGVPGLLQDLDTDTRNVLLTLARIWTTLDTGAIRPKDEAAAWVLERLPAEHRPALERARSMYLRGVEDDRWRDVDAVHALAAHLVDAIRTRR